MSGLFQILFPLLTKLLENINTQDPSGMEETRMRASTLLCKVGYRCIEQPFSHFIVLTYVLETITTWALKDVDIIRLLTCMQEWTCMEVHQCVMLLKSLFPDWRISLSIVTMHVSAYCKTGTHISRWTGKWTCMNCSGHIIYRVHYSASIQTCYFCGCPVVEGYRFLKAH